METKVYVVDKIDGDYAVLKCIETGNTISIARALLPLEIDEGTNLKYELFEYSILEK